MTKVIITGSRDYQDRETILSALVDIGATAIVEGGARGADRIARQCAIDLGLEVITVEADWDTHGKAAGHLRNVAMLEAHPDADAVLAFPLPTSVGTLDMCQEATRRGVAVIPFMPDPAIHKPSSRFDNGYYPGWLDRPIKRDPV